jgi:hypothetical protein
MAIGLGWLRVHHARHPKVIPAMVGAIEDVELQFATSERIRKRSVHWHQFARGAGRGAGIGRGNSRRGDRERTRLGQSSGKNVTAGVSSFPIDEGMMAEGGSRQTEPSVNQSWIRQPVLDAGDIERACVPHPSQLVSCNTTPSRTMPSTSGSSTGSDLKSPRSRFGKPRRAVISSVPNPCCMISLIEVERSASIAHSFTRLLGGLVDVIGVQVLEVFHHAGLAIESGDLRERAAGEFAAIRVFPGDIVRADRSRPFGLRICAIVPSESVTGLVDSVTS